MDKVWIVYMDDIFSRKTTIGVYSSSELAEECIKDNNNPEEHYYISECEVIKPS